MNRPPSWIRISEAEACSVVGGRNDQIGKLFEQLAAGFGIVIKFFWNLIQNIKEGLFPPETNTP